MNQQHKISSTPLDSGGLLSGQYWGELRIFAEVARAKSFNRAAERLGVSQPTIGRKVRRLQDLIGTQLCVATKHGVRLTRRGQELADLLRVLDQSLYSIANDIRARDKDAEGFVSLSISDGMGAFFAAPALTAFSAKFPKIQMHIKNMGNLNDLRENQTDMMLAFTPIDRGDVVCRPVGTLHFVPIANEAYVDRHGMPTLDTIENHFFLQSHLYQSEGRVWRDWQALVERGHVLHYCDNPFVYGMLVKQGLGIGLLGSYATRERSAIQVDLGAEAHIRLYAVALAERLESQPVRLAFDWLCETFAETVPWFQHDLHIPSLPQTLSSLGMMLDP